jgi:hypothetical protein
MTMIAKITDPVTPVAFGGVFAPVPRHPAANAPARRAAPQSATPNGPSLVIVVPDPIDALVEVGNEAGLKGGSKLLWTLGVLLLLAV